MTTIFRLGLLLLAWFALPGTLPAQESSAGSIESLNPGTHLFGADVATDDLFGKVVVIEIWGKT